ncbi:MAG: methyltransferase [Desulfurococcaceae archaeon]
MKIKIKFINRIILLAITLVNILPSLAVILNPLLFIMFIPIGLYAFLTWPWPVLKDIPDPFRPGESLYWLTYAIQLNEEHGILLPTIFNWGLIDLILVCAGSIIFVYSFTQWLINLKKRRGLMTGGMYRLVRHPQYLGLILLALGLTIKSLRPASIIGWITLLVSYLIMASLEEKSLINTYGERYLTYATKVPFLVPYIKFNLPDWLSVNKPWRYALFIAIWILSISLVIAIMRNYVFSLRNIAFQ